MYKPKREIQIGDTVKVIEYGKNGSLFKEGWFMWSKRYYGGASEELYKDLINKEFAVIDINFGGGTDIKHISVADTEINVSAKCVRSVHV